MSFFQRGEDLESGMGGDVESKYKKMYEDDINPFTAFSKKVGTYWNKEYHKLRYHHVLVLNSIYSILSEFCSGSISRNVYFDRILLGLGELKMFWRWT